MSKEPVAKFIDLPESDFPLLLEFLDAETGKVVWSEGIPGPGVTLVPSRTEMNQGRPVRARVTFADGEVRET